MGEKKKKKMKKPKDPTRPKAGSSAYIQWTTEQIPLMKKDPKYLGDGPKFGFKMTDGVELKHTDFMVFAGAGWNKLTDTEKEKYDKLAEKDKQRFEKQIKMWNDKGYYIMDDGTKSSRLAPKKSEDGSESEPEEEEVKPKKMSKKKESKMKKESVKQINKHKEEEELLFKSDDEDDE